ncbi:MAG: sigma-54 dependent transcriptional regulator [Proteobacteria bacterium]|nr:sigma-54 dependent transcriptional regulator [Pseudomonadota bacterium]
MKKILIVDDELAIRESLRMILQQDYEVLAVSSGAEALEKMREGGIDLVLLDVIMPGLDGIQLLERMKSEYDVPVIMITAANTVKTAVQAMRLGAYDYIPKPFDVDEIKIVVQKVLSIQDLSKEVEYLRAEISKTYGFENLIGGTKEMQEIFRLINQIAVSDTSVLILGESGTGKELVARAIHFNSLRKNKPFIPINCAAIPDTLIESELFGHERGAFTGASNKRIGKFEQAHSGTLFLDEIAELSLSTQAKILRFLQEREFTRVGGTETVHVDVRLITATNKDLENAIKDRSLREDFYYRINIIPISLPPLRMRRDDIPLLVNHFIDKVNKRIKKHVKRVSEDLMDFLVNYEWPGNVRELENLMERMITLSNQKVLTIKDLPSALKDKARPSLMKEKVVEDEAGQSVMKGKVVEGKVSFLRATEEFEKEVILDALKKTDNVQTQAAALLGISRRILKYKMDKLGIESE